jgi:hypothetical protein
MPVTRGIEDCSHPLRSNVPAAVSEAVSDPAGRAGSHPEIIDQGLARFIDSIGQTFDNTSDPRLDDSLTMPSMVARDDTVRWLGRHLQADGLVTATRTPARSNANTLFAPLRAVPRR